MRERKLLILWPQICWVYVLQSCGQQNLESVTLAIDLRILRRWLKVLSCLTLLMVVKCERRDVLMEENLKRAEISVWQLQKVPTTQIANDPEILTLVLLTFFGQFDTNVDKPGKEAS